jgi:pSer/pThr/pTyr-binding forkhead associated (FHA) protein
MPTKLTHGDVLRFGRVWVEVRFEAILPTPHPHQVTKDLAIAMVARTLDREGFDLTPRLVVLSGPDEGKEVSLADAGHAVIIGRGHDVGFLIDVSEASRRHARVVRKGDVLLLRDLGSRNGTQTKEEQVAIDRDTMLRAGEEFQIGSDVFSFLNPAAEVLRQIEIAEDETLASDADIGLPPKSSVQPEPSRIQEKVSDETPRDSLPVPTTSMPRNVKRSTEKKASGWGKLDLLIVLLALGVFTISALGLLWLFKGL